MSWRERGLVDMLVKGFKSPRTSIDLLKSDILWKYRRVLCKRAQLISLRINATLFKMPGSSDLCSVYCIWKHLLLSLWFLLHCSTNPLLNTGDKCRNTTRLFHLRSSWFSIFVSSLMFIRSFSLWHEGIKSSFRGSLRSRDTHPSNLGRGWPTPLAGSISHRLEFTEQKATLAAQARERMLQMCCRWLDSEDQRT
jgi:hypothetical protein